METDHGFTDYPLISAGQAEQLHQLYETDNINRLSRAAKYLNEREVRNIAFHRMFHMRGDFSSPSHLAPDPQLERIMDECVLNWFLHHRSFNHSKAYQLLNHVPEPVMISGFGAIGKRVLERFSLEGIFTEEENHAPASLRNILWEFPRKKEDSPQLSWEEQLNIEYRTPWLKHEPPWLLIAIVDVDEVPGDKLPPPENDIKREEGRRTIVVPVCQYSAIDALEAFYETIASDVDLLIPLYRNEYKSEQAVMHAAEQLLRVLVCSLSAPLGVKMDRGRELIDALGPFSSYSNERVCRFPYIETNTLLYYEQSRADFVRGNPTVRISKNAILYPIYFDNDVDGRSWDSGDAHLISKQPDIMSTMKGKD